MEKISDLHKEKRDFWLFLTGCPLVGSPSRARPQWSPPPPHTRQTAPLSSIQPFFKNDKEEASLKLRSIGKTDTRHANSTSCAPVVGGRTFLPTTLRGYGCGQDIATNVFPPNEDPPCL